MKTTHTLTKLSHSELRKIGLALNASGKSPQVTPRSETDGLSSPKDCPDRETPPENMRTHVISIAESSPQLWFVSMALVSYMVIVSTVVYNLMGTAHDHLSEEGPTWYHSQLSVRTHY